MRVKTWLNASCSPAQASNLQQHEGVFHVHLYPLKIEQRGSKCLFSIFVPLPAAICLLKKLLEPDPNKRPNIHQVMADSWLQLANKNTGAPYLNR